MACWQALLCVTKRKIVKSGSILLFFGMVWKTEILNEVTVIHIMVFIVLPHVLIQCYGFLVTEKAMVVSLSSLMNDSVPDKVDVTKFNLPVDMLLLLDLAHGPESDAVQTLWTKMQNYAKHRGTVCMYN